jgi:DNA-binding transcriptional ArsR family regulator
MARRTPSDDVDSSSPSQDAGRGAARVVQAPDADLLADAAETFSMLSSPIRLHLLWLLAGGAQDVGSLAEAVGASVATVSQHLGKLRLSDLVTARRAGKYQVYEVDDPHVITLVQQALDHHADLRARLGRPPAGSARE